MEKQQPTSVSASWIQFYSRVMTLLLFSQKKQMNTRQTIIASSPQQSARNNLVKMNRFNVIKLFYISKPAHSASLGGAFLKGFSVSWQQMCNRQSTVQGSSPKAWKLQESKEANMDSSVQNNHLKLTLCNIRKFWLTLSSSFWLTVCPRVIGPHCRMWDGQS